jgi:hypothetical protein
VRSFFPHPHTNIQKFSEYDHTPRCLRAARHGSGSCVVGFVPECIVMRKYSIGGQWPAMDHILHLPKLLSVQQHQREKNMVETNDIRFAVVEIAVARARTAEWIVSYIHNAVIVCHIQP